MNFIATSSVPDQSDNRSTGGIIVHILALFTSFVGPAIMYAIFDNEFTRENARNAINWHITFMAIGVVAFVTTALGGTEITVSGQSTELSVVPSPLDTVFTFIGVPVMIAFGIGFFLTLWFAVIATYKAAYGSTWSYPGAINIIGRFS